MRGISFGEFALVALTALAGYAGVSVWLAIGVSAGTLVFVSAPKYLGELERARRAGVEWRVWQFMALSVLNAVVAAALAWGLGAVLRMWGP